MKFDYCVGNPAYQMDNENNGRAKPLYNLFMDEAQKVADKVEMIHPARFLFNAGQTPKQWNEKMLNDEHFKVLKYEPTGSNIFPNTDIKGGVAITYRDANKDFGAIKQFIENPFMNSVVNKTKNEQAYMDSIVSTGVPYKFSDFVRENYPKFVDLIGASFDLRTNILDKLNNKLFFTKQKSNEDVQVFGLLNKKRQYLWISEKCLITPDNFDYYKVLMPKANGKGEFGEPLSKLEIVGKKVGHTQSFLSAGKFETEQEAINLEKYLKTKFARALLSILRKTQDTTAYKWKHVPQQDFTSNSDIDWSKSIPEIDQQLYRKYGLSEKEINFIETNVKEMN